MTTAARYVMLYYYFYYYDLLDLDFRVIFVVTGTFKSGGISVLARILIFFQKRSYLIFLGSYLQKRGVIHSQRKLRDKARKLCERV